MTKVLVIALVLLMAATAFGVLALKFPGLHDCEFEVHIHCDGEQRNGCAGRLLISENIIR
jgi:hypothetical protein